MKEKNLLEEQEERYKSVLDVLLDDDNCEPIVLRDDTGKMIAFEQIAVITYNETIYCLLKPCDDMKGIADDEAIVFYVVEQDGKEPCLMVEADMEKAHAVYNIYRQMMEEMLDKKKSEQST